MGDIGEYSKGANATERESRNSSAFDAFAGPALDNTPDFSGEAVKAGIRETTTISTPVPGVTSKSTRDYNVIDGTTDFSRSLEARVDGKKGAVSVAVDVVTGTIKGKATVGAFSAAVNTELDVEVSAMSKGKPVGNKTVQTGFFASIDVPEAAREVGVFGQKVAAVIYGFEKFVNTFARLGINPMYVERKELNFFSDVPYSFTPVEAKFSIKGLFEKIDNLFLNAPLPVQPIETWPNRESFKENTYSTDPKDGQDPINDGRNGVVGSGQTNGGTEGAGAGAKGGSGTSFGGTRGGDKPLILDLDDNGIELVELTKSTVFMDATNDGLKNRTAWAGVDDGVLFFHDAAELDPGQKGELTEKRQYVFTEWDPTATSDIEALRSVFDSNGDGVLDNTDTTWSSFWVLVTKEDGSFETKSLDDLGITSIDLTADATNIELPDGSVITGKTTFTKSDGTTGTVADTTLISESQSYRIEESTPIISGGERTVTKTGYHSDGSVAFVNKSVTATDGSSVENSYDDNGDGVVDRIQTITIVTVSGEKVETTINLVGADTATAILESKTVKTTSSDGSTITFDRDSTGGGWFDQTEVWTTHGDDSVTIVTTDKSKNGTPLRISTEDVSSNGLTRTDVIDENGDLTTDLTISHVIQINGNGSRTETITYTNNDGTIRSKVVEDVDALGRSKTITRDLDGDGDTDVLEEMDITVATDGTTSNLIVKNQDGSTRSTVTHEQSDDALSKTVQSDLDGINGFELTTEEITTIDENGKRVTETTLTNNDGTPTSDPTIRAKKRVTLESDKITSKTEVDRNQDGVFQAYELTRDVSVDGSTQEKTAIDWARNVDGSYSSKITTVSSDDGLSRTITVDADGDDDTDSVTTDVTVLNGNGSSTRTIEVRNQDNSLRSASETLTSQNGLTSTTMTDLDGDEVDDRITVVSKVKEVGGGATITTTTHAGNGTTLLEEREQIISADRRSIITHVDENGDGNVDQTTEFLRKTGGKEVETTTRFFSNGDVASSVEQTTSADGLEITTLMDQDGDGLFETKVVDSTVLNTDGSRTQTVTTTNGDETTRTVEVTTVSDDGLEVTRKQDRDSDGDFERTTTSISVLEADGSVATTDTVTSKSGDVLSRTKTVVSDDGFVETIYSDRDGDNTYDLTETRTTELLNDGGTKTTNELLNGPDLQWKSVTEVNDDGRDTTETHDRNGDQVTDFVRTRLEGDDGTVTVTESDLNVDGSLQSQVMRTTSDTGLVVEEMVDFDGDGQHDRKTLDVTVLKADGSIERTVTEESFDGTDFRETVTETSDDGLVVTTRYDLDADGFGDLTEVQTVTLALDGSEKVETESTSRNATTLSTSSVETSADKKTISELLDADGNGFDDQSIVTTIANDGIVKREAEFFSTGGALQSTQTTEISGDGSRTRVVTDRNADGYADLTAVVTDVLSVDGTRSRDAEYRDHNNVLIARETSVTSDDGLLTRMAIDIDGDGTNDYVSEDVTKLRNDGDVERQFRTWDSAGAELTEIIVDTTGDGLTTRTTSDYTGSGGPDRIVEYTESADGSWTRTTEDFSGGLQTARSVSETMSADGRAYDADTDLDGDGFIDRKTDTDIDLDRTVVTTVADIAMDGTTSASAKTETLANGSQTTRSFDLDGDGVTEYTQTSTTEVKADGDTVETIREVYGNGEVTYEEIITTSADGLTLTKTIDMDGDGSVDGTLTRTTDLLETGGQETGYETVYADGSFRSKGIETVSADGRTITQSHDFDGNGVADKKITTVIGSDGRTVRTETAYSKSGYENDTFVTTTTADGLITTVLRGDTLQTITRSPIDNGSYTWDNGITPSASEEHVLVTHEVDALGVETWTSTRATDTTTTTHTARLDAEAMDQVMGEAARIFDTVLDRDIDFNEREVLVEYVNGGQLDRDALVADLTSSQEFATRYGTLTDTEFVTQIYLNAFGRPPSMQEINQHLTAISQSVESRDSIAAQVAESAEHLAVGNTHLATNNFDVIMNPAQFERNLDKSYVEDTIEKIVGVTYGREPTQRELDYFTDQLLTDTDNPEDIAAKLLTISGEVYGKETNTLNGLTGEDLVQQAYLNATGQPADADVVADWVGHLNSGRISTAQFVSSMALSVENAAAGDDHNTGAIPSVNTLTGTGSGETLTGGTGSDLISGLDGADVITGGTGSDWIKGGTGADLLDGGLGNDFYEWKTGDGNDTISDTTNVGEMLVEEDRLVLVDVASTGVSLTRSNGSWDLKIKINATGEEIIDQYHYYFPLGDGRKGIEAIEFSDGVVWSKQDIQAQTVVEGLTGNDSIVGTKYDDAYFGGAGDDTLGGSGGDDTLVGGTGVDQLYGTGGLMVATDGNDRFIWQRGDDSDFIRDYSQSKAELDTLELVDVASTEVSLYRNNGSTDLKIEVENSGSANEIITVVSRFDNSDYGYGIEVIEFSDGVTWTLDDILENTRLDGSGSNDNLSGTSYGDQMFGAGGNDTLVGQFGDDTLLGDTGDDILYGGNGATHDTNGYDRYVWSKGDGNDTIYEYAKSTAEVDVLQLTDVDSSEVTLTRANLSNDLVISIGSPTEQITISERFQNTSFGYGIEAIEFADGTTWSMQDLLSRTRLEGTGDSYNYLGTAYRDNFFGAGGDDVFSGGFGDDVIVGGAGADTLRGGWHYAVAKDGNDRYVWSKGDGNDLIQDFSQSMSEVDSLDLVNVSSSEVTLTRTDSEKDLKVTIDATGEYITIDERFQNPAYGYGVETIEFSDGVRVNVLNSSAADVQVVGTMFDETLSGWGFRDEILGDAGNDVINGQDGDDIINGGVGIDTLYGGTGNVVAGDGSDTYVWQLNDDNDLIIDYSRSLTETDTLRLTDVASGDVKLTRVNGNNDLLVEIEPTGEVITIDERYQNTSYGYGIESIEFSDGVVWNLSDILDAARVRGTTGDDNYSGTAYKDHFIGKAGNDVFAGGHGDDVMSGGLGDDVLRGGWHYAVASDGNDRYVWYKGEGNDTIGDYSQSLTETDILDLRDVDSTDVKLLRPTGTDDLKIEIISTNESILVDGRFQNASFGYGIESIEFGDGVVWTLDDIWAMSVLEGTSDADVILGVNIRDNFIGYAGDDTFVGGLGDDVFIGGTGNDTLRGGWHYAVASDGNDRYIWSKDDDHDLIQDFSQSLTEVDTLELTDVASTEVTLSRSNGSNDLVITVDATNETITIDERFQNAGFGYGIETIEFSDGVVWTLDDIVTQTRVTGTAAAETLTGTQYKDNLIGLDGNDVLNGGDANDVLEGGAGADTLSGGSGQDAISYETSDAAVTISLTNGTASGGHATGDVLQDVEDVIGSAFDDVLEGDGGNNVLKGLDGKDTLTGHVGADFLDLGAGNDVGHGGDQNDTIYGDIGNDTINGDAGDDVIDGGGGGDLINVHSGDDTVSGGNGTDVINGGDGADVIDGGTSHDTISGDDGNDYIDGGGGQDHLSGQLGDDTILGGIGVDVIYGGAGADEIDGGDAQDTIYAGDDNDSVWGGIGADTVYLEDGDDVFYDDDGYDYVEGGDGADTIVGAGGNDSFYGNTGADSISGGLDDDLIAGGNGADTLLGELGDDTLDGGRGSDILSGGDGQDKFVFGANDGQDSISDFSLSELDRLELDDALWASSGTLTTTQVVDTRTSVAGQDLVFTFDNGDTLTLTGVTTTVGLADQIDII